MHMRGKQARRTFKSIIMGDSKNEVSITNFQAEIKKERNKAVYAIGQ